MKTRKTESKPVMFVVSDPQTGAVVLTHRTVNVGLRPRPAVAAEGNEQVMELLKRVKAAKPETLKIEKIDPASWQGPRKRPAS